jgi:hypothetical protein
MVDSFLNTVPGMGYLWVNRGFFWGFFDPFAAFPARFSGVGQ